jgi:phosphatidylglycerophosphate synthase
VANALTAIRLLLVVPIGLLIAADHPRSAILAAIALVIAIATDLADGPVARRAGSASPMGGTFDHTTDFLFVVSGMAGGVARGAFPWILPALVVGAFVQYAVDSRWLQKGRGFRGSRLGRYNGILYFVPICGDTLVRLGLGFLRPAVALVCWLLVISTVVSIGQRAWALRQARRTAPAWPSEETPGRSPR